MWEPLGSSSKKIFVKHTVARTGYVNVPMGEVQWADFCSFINLHEVLEGQVLLEDTVHSTGFHNLFPAFVFSSADWHPSFQNPK